MAYIPRKHSEYDLLPLCKETGGEVFAYPSVLIEKIHELISESVYPYGYDSYEDYEVYLNLLIEKYGIAGQSNPINGKIEELITKFRMMNIKEDWSVVQYLGESNCNFTKGRYYYWPCFKERPEYEGIIDDEEFTSYLHHIEPDDWRIIEDPLGIAKAELESLGRAKK